MNFKNTGLMAAPLNAAGSAMSQAAASTAYLETCPEPPWYSAICNAIDYGIMVLAADGTLAFVNTAARRGLGPEAALLVDSSGRLRARCASDDERLTQGRIAACERGLRRMLSLGGSDGPVLALSGLANRETPGRGHCLVLLSRRAIWEKLSLDMYARLHGLTPAETEVLTQLVAGFAPTEIAQRLEVRLSTVRTHISKILNKNGHHSLRNLVLRIATLPPAASLLAACWP